MRTLGFAIACAASMLVACGTEASKSGAPATMEDGDAGVQMPADDGGTITPAAVPRKMITAPLFESGDVENRVGDPLIELRQWFFTDPMTGAATVHVNRLALAQSPGGQATLFVPGASQNPHGVTFGVTFKLPSVAYVASMWIGAKDKDITGIFPAVITSDDDGTGMPGYFQLDPDPTKSDVLVAGIHWTRFTVNAEAPNIAGWGYLYGGTDGSQDLYVAGLEVLAGSGHMDPIAPHASHPAASRAQLEAARRFVTHAKKHHPAPPKPAAR